MPAGSVDEVTEALIAELRSAATVAVGLAKLLVLRSLSSDLHRHLAEEGLAIELASRSDDSRKPAAPPRTSVPPDFQGR